MVWVADMSIFDMVWVADMSIFDMLWVAAILAVPPIMPLALPMLELGDGVPVELLALFLLQATSTNAARTGIANTGIVNFIGLFSFCSF
jgi:hypothetical protein